MLGKVSFVREKKGEKDEGVLVSFERAYRVYIEAIASATREFRPDVEVAVTDAGELEASYLRF